MAKVEKVFQTQADAHGFSNELTIMCEYNDKSQSIDDLEVYAYSQRKNTLIEITEIFETVPELVDLVDNIDWREIYCNEKAESLNEQP